MEKKFWKTSRRKLRHSIVVWITKNNQIHQITTYFRICFDTLWWLRAAFVICSFSSILCFYKRSKRAFNGLVARAINSILPELSFGRFYHQILITAENSLYFYFTMFLLTRFLVCLFRRNFVIDFKLTSRWARDLKFGP